ncbi:L,D-transpeptidase family protein [Rhizobium sp. KVB221]|uniref:L,D-transpeptidase family protein n=1 Tax=Rhizobium setariae TaxID=2801340 RepID=A0A936YRX9_9HYPH|nr:L,D-transpeptidase family protein [Rhizobium setariae]MBL0371265.1 L,D-transpeptidase family protein [Rhizobium setariae]
MFTRVSLGIAFATSMLFATTAMATDAPLQIFVSKDTQSLVVYDGEQVVATSNVSTGKAGHTTPSGIFSILEKKKTHFSNLYDDAPMPFMQRITWSGIALHESGSVPSYPASHGCIRMPRKFAKTLYQMTKRGFHVVVSDRKIAPHTITTAELFKPRFPHPSPQLLSDAALRPAMPSDGARIEVAMAETLPKAGATAVATLPQKIAPVRVLITRASDTDRAATIQAMLNRLGYDAGPVDGLHGIKLRAAIKAYQDLHGQKPSGEMTQQFVASIYKVMNRKVPTGWLYVRQNFKPIFDGPVEIADPEIALGTHFFTASDVNAAQNHVRWHGVTLDNHIPDKTARRLGITRPAESLASDAAERAFLRIGIPDDMRERVETMLGDGSSITITDNGTQHETGLGTDFITITRKAPRG